MVRWMCDIMLKDRVPSKGLRDTSIRQHNHCTRAKQVVMYRHVLQKEDNDSVKKCMEYNVEGARPRGRPKKTWTEIVPKDCQSRKLNMEDDMHHN